MILITYNFVVQLLGGAIILVLFTLCTGEASEVESLYVEAEKSVLSNRNYELENIHTRKGSLNLGFDLSLDNNKHFYWNNRIESTFAESQFKQIAWRFEVGAHVGDDIDLYYSHYSSHVLDGYNRNVIKTPSDKYPEINSIGFRWRMK